MGLEETRHEINHIITNIWHNIGMNLPENHQRIVDYIFTVICLKGLLDSWTRDDVVDGLRDWINNVD